MPVTTTPAFIQTPRAVQVQLANANNTNRDGTGTMSAAMGVGANGSLISYINFTQITATAVGTLQVFYDDGLGGGKKLLGPEIPYTALILSNSVGAPSYQWIPPNNQPFSAPAGANFYFTFGNNSETWNSVLVGADF